VSVSFSRNESARPLPIRKACPLLWAIGEPLTAILRLSATRLQQDLEPDDILVDRPDQPPVELVDAVVFR
jgi:hypothetical protein